MLTLGVVVGLWRAQMRTQRAEVHEAGEGDSPDVPGVDNVATIELEEEPVLDIRVCEHRIKQRTDQKIVG